MTSNPDIGDSVTSAIMNMADVAAKTGMEPRHMVPEARTLDALTFDLFMLENRVRALEQTGTK